MKRFLFIAVVAAAVAVGCKAGDVMQGPDEFDVPVAGLKDPSLSWSEASVVALLGQENVFPVLSNPYGMEIAYSSSEPDVATVNADGAVTLVGTGVSEITASTQGDDNYFAAVASYILIVRDPEESGEGGDLTFASTGDPGSDDDISNTTFAGKITITYTSTTAVVDGDTYGYVTVDGNKVTVNNTGGQVLVYELKGSTSNGYFKVYGAKKQAILLNGVTITNPDGAAINNQNKKRTFVVVEGDNKLSDGASAAYTPVGEEDQKAVFFSEAQLVFSGSGLLTVNALNDQEKAGITADDYIRLLESPVVKVTCGAGAGNGVKGKKYVQLSRGSLVVSIAGAMKKGISSDDYVLVEGGTHMVSSTGGVAYDEEDAEYSGTAGVKADNYFAMTGGSLTIQNTGDGGKGIRAGVYDFDETNHALADSYITGGTLTVTTNGKESNDVSAKGIKIGWVTKSGTGIHTTVTGHAGNMTVSGGTIIVNCASGEGFEVKGDLTIDGGEIHVTSTGDDGINAQGDLVINDGLIYAYSSMNDALDSNGDTKINGGKVLAVSTAGTPEVAIDANTEDGYRLYIYSGATVVAYGGLERNYYTENKIYSMTVLAGQWNALSAGGTAVAAFKGPSSISKYIVSAPSLSAGLKGVSVSGTPKCNGAWALDGISGGSSAELAEYTGGDSGGHGPGGPGSGGPPGGGGMW